MLLFRPPLAVANMLFFPVTVLLVVSIFAVGFLTWRNYEGTADIWVENFRGRGFNKAGLGWVMDRGTARAIGAGKVIFTVVMAVAIVVQRPWL
jgi:hypothetical protein